MIFLRGYSTFNMVGVCWGFVSKSLFHVYILFNRLKISNDVQSGKTHVCMEILSV